MTNMASILMAHTAGATHNLDAEVVEVGEGVVTHIEDLTVSRSLAKTEKKDPVH